MTERIEEIISNVELRFEEMIANLEARTIEHLPKGWKKGLKCPECNASAEVQKCIWELGGSCPRHDPDNYHPSPFIQEPDPICVEAARLLRERLK